jgi:hypothetical protein
MFPDYLINAITNDVHAATWAAGHNRRGRFIWLVAWMFSGSESTSAH